MPVVVIEPRPKAEGDRLHNGMVPHPRLYLEISDRGDHERHQPQPRPYRQQVSRPSRVEQAVGQYDQHRQHQRLGVEQQRQHKGHERRGVVPESPGAAVQILEEEPERGQVRQRLQHGIPRSDPGDGRGVRRVEGEDKRRPVSDEHSTGQLARDQPDEGHVSQVDTYV